MPAADHTQVVTCRLKFSICSQRLSTGFLYTGVTGFRREMSALCKASYLTIVLAKVWVGYHRQEGKAMDDLSIRQYSLLAKGKKLTIPN